MADYYSILGLTKNATDIEIKTAFRKLAKIYHPDKNPDPNARILFEHILKAYDTLINPHSRRRYDSLGASTSIPQKTTTRHSTQRNRGQKEWNTDEEDLKRREYYKQHYHHAKKKAPSTEQIKPNYSDYKNVLFATPIAVGLLMIIISLFSSEPELKSNPISEKIENPITEIVSPFIQLNNGDKPYNGFFGNIKTFDTQHVLQINNSSNYDAVIVVFDKKTNQYLQHGYLRNSYTIEFSKLPNTGVYWKCVLGKNWNKDKLFFNEQVSGGFDSIVQYQNWQIIPTLFSQELEQELTLLYVLNDQSNNKQYISNDIDFFKK